MRLLPGFAACGHLLRWPCSPRSAAALAEGLLTDTNRGVRLLAPALAEDPPLVLWIECQANLDEPGLALCSVEQAARWLLCRGWRHIAAVEDSGDSTPPPTEGPHLADLVARSIQVARLAARLASQDDRDLPIELPASRPRGVDVPDEAYLIGLLHAAPRWIAQVQGAEADVAAICATILPAWLASGLDALVRSDVGNQSGAVHYVARARAALVETSTEPSGLASPAPGDDELRRLRDDWLTQVPGAGRQLHALVGRLLRLEALETRFAVELEREKLEALAEFAAGAGHEINNPLAVMSGRAQLLLDGERDPQRRRELAVIHAQALRVYEMVADMMLFARPPHPRKELVDVGAMVDKLFVELESEAREHGVALRRATGNGVPDSNSLKSGSLIVHVDATQLAVVLRAICHNSLAALDPGGAIEIGARAIGGASAAGAGNVEIVIADNGPGIRAEVRRHLFDPFYSGRGAGRGLGIGLAKSWRIVTNHGGTIEVESSPGAGARFVIRLPADSPPPSTGTGVSPAP